jgi:V8-like Glu-specific endopeptidase
MRSTSRTVATPLSAVVAVTAAALIAAACGAETGARGEYSPSAAAYWDSARLRGARPFIAGQLSAPATGQSADSHLAGPQEGLRVGALFVRDADGDHFCTASVVASPGKDLLITAAHCINGGKSRKGYRHDIVFIPDYRDGRAPFGVWTPARLFVPPQWARSSNPDYDVGFVVLQQHDGLNIQQVLGGNRLGDDVHYQYLVHVTGYPDSRNAPITCVNWTARFSDTQLLFDCFGFGGGTSGSPWVISFSPRSRTGTIVGVIGGYQDGGNKPTLSYSPRIGPAIERLYREAAAAGLLPAAQALSDAPGKTNAATARQVGVTAARLTCRPWSRTATTAARPTRSYPTVTLRSTFGPMTSWLRRRAGRDR